MTLVYSVLEIVLYVQRKPDEWALSPIPTRQSDGGFPDSDVENRTEVVTPKRDDKEANTESPPEGPRGPGTTTSPATTGL